MIKINIKPLSVNRAYKGRRFLTENLKAYQKELQIILPKELKIDFSKLSIFYEFGFSSKASDVDNPVKIITDILAENYGFNDKQIYEIYIKKTIVKKGKEYIKFKIKEYKE